MLSFFCERVRWHSEHARLGRFRVEPIAGGTLLARCGGRARRSLALEVQGISDLIRRLSDVAFPGGGAKFVPPSQGTTTPTPTLEELQRRVTAERDTAIQTAQRAVKWWWFEKIWSLIYRSQIEILEALGAAPNGMMPWLDLHGKFYVPLVTRFPGFGVYQFPQYMGFLANTATFVTWDVNIDRTNPPVTITALGREFLEYMHTQGYSKDARIY